MPLDCNPGPPRLLRAPQRHFGGRRPQEVVRHPRLVRCRAGRPPGQRLLQPDGEVEAAPVGERGCAQAGSEAGRRRKHNFMLFNFQYLYPCFKGVDEMGTPRMTDRQARHYRVWYLLSDRFKTTAGAPLPFARFGLVFLDEIVVLKGRAQKRHLAVKSLMFLSLLLL